MDILTPTVNLFKELVRSGDFVVLDTETTGIYSAEVVQIAVIDSQGNVLLDTLVQPVREIPDAATRIHGITDADVVNAPTWLEVGLRLIDFIAGRNVIVWNADFDRRVMNESDQVSLKPTKLDDDFSWDEVCNWYCAMTAYAEHYGKWNERHQSYTYQSLASAQFQLGLPPRHGHSALEDCRACLTVIERMCGIVRPSK